MLCWLVTPILPLRSSKYSMGISTFQLMSWIPRQMLSGWKREKKTLGTAGRCPRLFGGVPHTSKLQMLGLAVGCGSLSPMKQEKWGSIVILHDLAMSKSPRSQDYSHFVLFVRSPASDLWDFSPQLTESWHLPGSSPRKRRGWKMISSQKATREGSNRFPWQSTPKPPNHQF